MSVSRLAVFTAVVVSQISAAYALTKATSHISITKVASLQVSNIGTDHLQTDSLALQMMSNACLQTGSEPIPYRVSAESLKGKSNFAATNDARHSRMEYAVIWSGEDDQFRLNNGADVSDVIHAEAGVDCDDHTLAIELDAGTFRNASAAIHTDTLSLIFIIE